eukprot:scaffold3344_cov138-Isochrysis_galbana.AAC.9
MAASQAPQPHLGVSLRVEETGEYTHLRDYQGCGRESKRRWPGAMAGEEMARRCEKGEMALPRGGHWGGGAGVDSNFRASAFISSTIGTAAGKSTAPGAEWGTMARWRSWRWRK